MEPLIWGRMNNTTFSYLSQLQVHFKFLISIANGGSLSFQRAASKGARQQDHDPLTQMQTSFIQLGEPQLKQQSTRSWPLHFHQLSSMPWIREQAASSGGHRRHKWEEMKVLENSLGRTHPKSIYGRLWCIHNRAQLLMTSQYEIS